MRQRRVKMDSGRIVDVILLSVCRLIKRQKSVW